MKIKENSFLKNLRYLCLVGIIALGLFTIVGSNGGGGGGTATDGTDGENGTTATLDSIAVTPTNPSIAPENSQQFTATGTYSDGTTDAITISDNTCRDNNASNCFYVDDSPCYYDISINASPNTLTGNTYDTIYL